MNLLNPNDLTIVRGEIYSSDGKIHSHASRGFVVLPCEHGKTYGGGYFIKESLLNYKRNVMFTTTEYPAVGMEANQVSGSSDTLLNSITTTEEDNYLCITLALDASSPVFGNTKKNARYYHLQEIELPD